MFASDASGEAANKEPPAQSGLYGGPFGGGMPGFAPGMPHVPGIVGGDFDDRPSPQKTSATVDEIAMDACDSQASVRYAPSKHAFFSSSPSTRVPTAGGS